MTPEMSLAMGDSGPPLKTWYLEPL